MVFYGFHGVFAEERSLGQRFIVSLNLTTNHAHDKEIHKLEDTVDYTKVYAVFERHYGKRPVSSARICCKCYTG